MVATEIKSVVVGEAGTGKTSLSSFFCLGSCPSTPSSTVGASFLQKRVTLPPPGGGADAETNKGSESSECCLQIWDTAGQERFRALAPMYYRGARAAVVVCDCTDMDSFRRVGSWLDDLERSRRAPPPT